jgi:hypothetical protein
MRFAFVLGVALCAVTALALPGNATAIHPNIQTPTVSALTLSTRNVTSSSPSRAVTLTWTISDPNAAATGVGGVVSIRMRGAAPNTFTGRTVTAQYLYQGSIFGQASYVSGTVRKSTYTYAFEIPPFAATTHATWVVTGLTADDGLGRPLDADQDALARFHPSVRAVETIDSTPPVLESVSTDFLRNGQQRYVYERGTRSVMNYTVFAEDEESGFWHGTITLAGPGGTTIRTNFELTSDLAGPHCGAGGGDAEGHDANCLITVLIPPGTPVGTWSVATVSLTDSADNTATYTPADSLPFVVTANNVIGAHDFGLTPEQVDNWRTDATARLTLTVTGARQGVAAIYTDLGTDAGAPCPQTSTTPTASADGTLSIPLTDRRRTATCPVQGIAVVDGLGDVAVYGPDYGAPGPALALNRLPDTTPPVALSARLDRPTIHTVTEGEVVATVDIAPQMAPITSYSMQLYDSDGNVVPEAGAFGGTGEGGGQVVLPSFLPFSLAPGTYTFGFSLTDDGGLSSSYGEPGTPPVPGGPLTLTVTE